jgi:hypothetical protein
VNVKKERRTMGMTEEEISLANMDRICVLMRGKILHIYSTMEVLIDDIIRKSTFKNESDFLFYTTLFGIGHINTKTKSRILKHCLVNYDKNYNKDTTFIRDKIDNITDKRHKLAHWVFDNSKDGIDFFKNNHKIRLVSYNKNKTHIYEAFDFEISQRLELEAYEIVSTLIDVQSDLSS